jgi:hypothetical protein
VCVRARTRAHGAVMALLAFKVLLSIITSNEYLQSVRRAGDSLSNTNVAVKWIELFCILQVSDSNCNRSLLNLDKFRGLGLGIAV